MSTKTRVPHILTPARAARYPRRVVCLGWECEPDPGRSGTIFAVDRLSHWTSVLLEGRGGRYHVRDVTSGWAPPALQGHLASLLPRRGPLWLLTPYAARLIAMAGIWGLVDGHTWGIVSRPCPGARGADAERLDRLTPQVILSDPPTVVPFRVGPDGPTLTVLDSRNWGWGPQPDRLEPVHVAADLAAWWTAWCALLDNEGLGGVCKTAGAQAYHTWRHAHLAEMVQVHCDGRALALESAAYGPGRCECYRLGHVNGPVYHLDAHALYPTLVSTHDLPARLLGVTDHPEPEWAEQVCRKNLVIAEVDIETAAPLAPHTEPRGGLVTWPIGRWRTTLCGPELRLLAEAGAITRWRRLAWYKGAPIGRSFAMHMLRLRDTPGMPDDIRQTIKLVSNSLVGKWGQSAVKWVDRRSNYCHAPWDAWEEPDGAGGWARWRSLGWLTQREERGGPASQAVPAAAAYVVSLARAWLWWLMETAGWDHVHYCDTDGVMVDRPGRDLIMAAQKAGSLGPARIEERAVYPWLHLYGLRQWAAGEVSQAAGRPLRQPGGEVPQGAVWVNVGPRGHLAGRRQPEAARHVVDWHVPTEYRHGTVQPDGTVCPLVRSDRED